MARLSAKHIMGNIHVLKKISYELKEYYDYCERYYWFGGILEPMIVWFVLLQIIFNS
jgi:hypothetical protein